MVLANIGRKPEQRFEGNFNCCEGQACVHYVRGVLHKQATRSWHAPQMILANLLNRIREVSFQD